jgi:hypothetical protein
MKNSNETIGKEPPNLPACSAVPQPNVPRAACPNYIPIHLSIRKYRTLSDRLEILKWDSDRPTKTTSLPVSQTALNAITLKQVLRVHWFLRKKFLSLIAKTKINHDLLRYINLTIFTSIFIRIFYLFTCCKHFQFPFAPLLIL